MTVATIKDGYKADYLELQKTWKSHSPELLLVGRLSYWLYWLSKTAEQCSNGEERNNHFQLKSDGIHLLSQSNYTRIKKYVPDFHKRVCPNHYKMMKGSKLNNHYFLNKNQEKLLNCQSCRNGQSNYFSLYSLAILDNNDDTNPRNLLYIFYVPYPLFKNTWPTLDELKQVKFYPGHEYGTIRQSKEDNKQPLDNVYSTELIMKKVKENHQKLENYLYLAKQEQ